MSEETVDEIPCVLKKLTEAEQWSLLKKGLADETLRRGKFTDAVERCMNTRSRVNIAKTCASVTEVLGEQYGVWVGDMLWEAALRTDIYIEDDYALEKGSDGRHHRVRV